MGFGNRAAHQHLGNGARRSHRGVVQDRTEQLVPHDGYYDLRITAELWETYYYDYLSLMAVDHPVGTEIYVDERFVIPAAKLAITSTEMPHKIVSATDDDGNDVTDVVSALDGKYLDNFGRGQYQGVTRDHYVEVDLGKDAPSSGPLWLIAKGWMHPTDSSVNVAMGQGKARNRARAEPGSARWSRWMVDSESESRFSRGPKENLPGGSEQCFSLRARRIACGCALTWKFIGIAIEWAKGLPDAQLKTVRLDPSVADLHYRGYSVIESGECVFAGGARLQSF